MEKSWNFVSPKNGNPGSHNKDFDVWGILWDVVLTMSGGQSENFEGPSSENFEGPSLVALCYHWLPLSTTYFTDGISN